jgi:sepiapterin reductase
MASLFFITGASRGFGAALAEALARAPPRGDASALVLVLLARDAAALAAVRARVLAAAPAARVVVAAADLAKLDSVEADFAAAIAAARGCLRPGERVARAALVNNAGSGGPVGAVADLADLAALRAAIDLNVTSCVWLTALFLRFARAELGAGADAGAVVVGAGTGAASTTPWRCAVVNVSSLCAVKPFPTLGAYCVGKAARDMLHSVIAAEAEGGGAEGAEGRGAGGSLTVATLSYAPGPMDTVLQGEMRGDARMDAGLRGFFEGLAAADTWVRADASAAKLARLLAEPGAFASGAHIDWYDSVSWPSEAAPPA